MAKRGDLKLQGQSGAECAHQESDHERKRRVHKFGAWLCRRVSSTKSIDLNSRDTQGVLEQVLGQLDYNILSTLKLNGFERNEIINDTWLQAYRAPFPTPAHAAGAIGWAKGFATGAHEFETPDGATKAELAKKPALAIWGEADRTLRAEQFLPLFSQAFPNGQVLCLPGAGHYSPEDAPEEVARLVAEFVAASAVEKGIQRQTLE